MDAKVIAHLPGTTTDVLSALELGRHFNEREASCCFSFRKGIATGGWRAAILVMGVEFLERLATLGIGFNLVIYLNSRMHLPLATSANVVTNFLGTSFIMCLLGGLVADTFLGRFRTVAVGASIQLIGILLIVLSATLPKIRPPTCEGTTCDSPSTHQVAILYAALYIIALGTGGLKSCVSGLGADQFDEENDQGRKMMQSFFNWFGMAVSSASVLAATMMAYIQDNVSYGVGYLLSLSCISGSFLLVMIASPLLHHKPASGSPIILIYNIFLAAWRNRKIRHPLTRTSDIICCQQKDFDEKIEAIRTNQFLFLDKAALNVNCKQNPDMKDCIEWNISTLQEVEDVKMFLRLLPILATTITFWTCNAQMITFSTQQASTLDRRLGRHFSIPAASLTVFVQLGCLMTLSIYEKLLIPLIRRWRRNEYGVTSLQRIGIGLMLSSSSLLIASLVEKKRLRIAKQFNHSTDAAWLPMSVFYLIPQYWLVGMGDAFGYVGQLEFFYRESPTRMRSLGSGLSLSSISLGFFFSSTLVDVVNRFSRNAANEGWLTNDLNTSRLDNFYLFVASCSILSLLAYLVCSQWYVYRDQWAIHQNKN